MPRFDDEDRRLRNWARSKLASTSGALGYAGVDLGEERVDCDRNGYDSLARIPTCDSEADETDAAIELMEASLRETLYRVYLRPRGSRENARLLGVAESTVYARVDAAKRWLKSHFSGKAQAAKDERERTEKLQRLAVTSRKGFSD